ncbi:hypothetical protein NMY22_g10489 [Coprinellus aureogranulatus]|nr:hypothetical protein NMY22_g10489 [Coprinellus aureogranulatus]
MEVVHRLGLWHIQEGHRLSWRENHCGILGLRMNKAAIPRGLQICLAYAQYAQAILTRRNHRRVQITLPAEMAFDDMAEVEKLVDIVLEAGRNPVYLGYSLEEVLTFVEKKGQNNSEALRLAFPGPFEADPETGEFLLLTRPTVFIDKNNTVLAWYLPGAFTSNRSEHVYKSCERLSLRQKSALGQASSAKRSWRNEENTFARPEKCRLTPGHLNLSENARFIPLNPKKYQASNSWPAPSANLENREGGLMDFLEDEVGMNALIGSLLAVTNPALFDMQLSVLLALGRGTANSLNRSTMQEAMHYWSTPFSGFALVVNRETPFHRDMNGGKALMDILAVFGRYRQGVSKYLYSARSLRTTPPRLLSSQVSSWSMAPAERTVKEFASQAI